LIHRLGAAAAAIVVEDQPTFIARGQSDRVAARAAVAVYAVNAACLVPPAVIGSGITSRTGFLRRHEPARADWLDGDTETPDVAGYTGPLPFARRDAGGRCGGKQSEDQAVAPTALRRQSKRTRVRRPHGKERGKSASGSAQRRGTLRSAERGKKCALMTSRSFPHAPDRHRNGQDLGLDARSA
jgi:hypothetical protein